MTRRRDRWWNSERVFWLALVIAGPALLWLSLRAHIAWVQWCSRQP